jgi:hypothetical protein
MSVDMATAVTANVLQSTTQDCINITYGGNTISVTGDFNVLSGVGQTVSISVSSKCGVMTQQASDFKSALSANLAQSLRSQQIALTGWLDSSRNDQSTSLQQSVTTNITQANVQNCLNTMNGYNILNVTGSGNVIKDVAQNASLNLVSECMLQNGQASKVVSDITDTVNQSAVLESKNPLAFIADAMAAAFSSIVYGVIAVIICVIMFVGAFVGLREYGKISRGQSTNVTT